MSRPKPSRCAAVLFVLSLIGCNCPWSHHGNSTDPQWVHRNTPHGNVALVFVHGVFGDTLGTWKPSSGPSFIDIISKDATIGPKVDTYAFGFPSNMFEAGSFDIQEAANRLHARLQSDGILDYPAIVFVAHSMGGLVVLRELLTHREIVTKVPVLVLYSTPQEGAQIAEIARRVAHNDALAQMLPADKDGYLRQLNDDWRSMNPRPPVQCAYEKRETAGLLIVPWTSATRFCDGTALAVDADHIGIVKPESDRSDSVVLLVNALNTYVIGEQLVPKLETPDFQVDAGQAVLSMTDPFGRRDARLVNAGGGKLTYTLNQFPDSGLYVFPSAGPADIGAHSMAQLQFALAYGATKNTYNFVLHSDVAPDLPVTVKIPDLGAVTANHARVAEGVLKDLEGSLDDPQVMARLMNAQPGGDDAAEQIVETVRASIAKQDPKLVESGQLVQAAELLNRVKWPGLAAKAIQRAVKAQPELEKVPSVRNLAARTGGLLSGDARILPSVTDDILIDGHSAVALMERSPFTTGDSLPRAVRVAGKLRQVPELKGPASTLSGDVKWASGDHAGAVRFYDDATAVTGSRLSKKLAAEARRHLPN